RSGAAGRAGAGAGPERAGAQPLDQRAPRRRSGDVGRDRVARRVDRRVLLFTGPRRIEIREEPLPPTPPGQALVVTEVSALSSGTWLLCVRCDLPPDLPIDETLGAHGGATFRYPFRYGYASVGTVAAIGDGVAQEWIGRRVFAFEPHASAFAAPVADLAVV